MGPLPFFSQLILFSFEFGKFAYVMLLAYHLFEGRLLFNVSFSEDEKKEVWLRSVESAEKRARN